MPVILVTIKTDSDVFPFAGLGVTQITIRFFASDSREFARCFRDGRGVFPNGIVLHATSGPRYT